jgi:hypothetical protein
VALSLGAACLGLTGCGGRRKRWDDSAYTYTDSNSDTYTDTHTDPNSNTHPNPDTYAHTGCPDFYQGI